MKLPEIKYLVFITCLVFFSSCATILNSPVQRVNISTDKNIEVVSVDRAVATDSSFIYVNSRRAFYIPRSNFPLKVNLRIESAQKTIFLIPKYSFAYWYNIPSTYGIGMLVDKDNIKRYGYPKWNYLTLEDTLIIRQNFAPVKKRTLNLSLSYPFLSAFNVKSFDGRYSSAGVLGLEAGLDYFHRDNNYLSLHIGIATDRFGEYFGPGYLQTADVKYASFRNNNIAGNFDFGYGANISQLRWAQQTIGDTIKIDHLIKSTRIGPSLSAQYRLGYYFTLGILYQPALLNADFRTSFNYQHYLSLNLSWKLPVYRPVN